HQPSVCTDVDECESSINDCDPNTTLCVNVIGNYLCECRTGYGNLSAGKCEDINECDNSTSCVKNADCINLNGTYNCTCREGFIGNGDISCTDIDECKTENVCGNHSICLNVIGSHNCSCERGYEGDPCMDVGDCKGNNDCHSNATCSNTDGGHNCTCMGGFAGNGSVCTDVDECERSINDCDQNTTMCVNGIGNYLCECHTGYGNLSAGKCEGKVFRKYLGGGGRGWGEWNIIKLPLFKLN
uniref:EGF-like domain-containing protein n=1 Tax=Eptatretus burgeri TaxID=7764 RepID=A0A8C4QA30_EPTBU